MKKPIRILAILGIYTISNLLVFSTVTNGKEIDKNTNAVKITKFNRKKTKCYCNAKTTENPLLFNSQDLNEVITTDPDKGLVFGSSSDNKRLKIQLPVSMLEKTNKQGCPNNHIDKKVLICWVKTRYVEGANIYKNSIASTSKLGVSRPSLCKDLGSVLGAGSCRK